VSLLLYATVFAFFVGRPGTGDLRPGQGPPSRPGTSVPPSDLRPAVRRTALTWTTLLLIAITLIQVTFGAQVRAGIDDAVAAGTPRRDALATVGAFDRWHRDTALMVFALMVIVFLQVSGRLSFGGSSPRSAPLVRAASLMAALVAVQVALGLTLAYLGLTPSVQVAHLTAASLLLGAETVLFLLARWLP
jgi:heme A synthase